MRVRRPPSVRALMLLALAGAGLAPGAGGAAPALRRMFVTSASGTGDLSSWGALSGNQDGIVGANQVCQSLAEAAGLAPAGEQFRAWISDSTTDAWCNVQGLTGKRLIAPACGGAEQPGGGPWVRTDGVLFGDSLTALASASAVYVPAELDENGDPITTTTSFMTGSFANATASSANCTAWTVTSGPDQPGSSATISSWASAPTMLTCSTVQRLACFELGEGLPVAKPSAPGHLVFVSSSSGTGDLGSWPAAGEATGPAAADAICRADAAAAGLPVPERFHAWLSDGGHDAACQARGLPGLVSTACDGATPPPDAPYRRVDGFVLADDFAGLLDGRLGTASALMANGGLVSVPVLTGTLADGTLSPLGTCSNWTSADTVTQYGNSFSLVQAWTQSGQILCNQTTLRLQCLGSAIVDFWDDFESGNLGRWSSKAP